MNEMIPISPGFFYVFAGAAIFFAALTVLKKNPVGSAFSLVLVFFCFAAIYAMLGAHLIAALQVLVYAGAIMVLFVFVIMLLNADQPSLDLARTSGAVRTAVGVSVLALIGVFAWVFQSARFEMPRGSFTLDAIDQSGGDTQVVSEVMFSDYLLPFELTSVLLLVAIVGAVAIAKRKGKGPTDAFR